MYEDWTANSPVLHLDTESAPAFGSCDVTWSVDRLTACTHQSDRITGMVQINGRLVST